MVTKNGESVVLRPKRQLTLPRALCERMGIEPGDRLELALEGTTLIARPRKKLALEALREIRNAFQRSGISEEKLQETGRQVRRELSKRKHGPRS